MARLQVTDDTAAMALSRALPRGTVLATLADAAWRKELFLRINVIRGALCRLLICARSS